MPKYVIQTAQIIKRLYYVEVNNPTWAHDSIVMSELEEFASDHLSEDIFSTTEVDEWPTQPRGIVNGSTAVYNYTTKSWDHETRWDLADENIHE